MDGINHSRNECLQLVKDCVKIIEHELIGTPGAAAAPIAREYVLMEDAAYPLNNRLMKPYSQQEMTSQREYCYKISRCCRSVDSTLLVMAQVVDHLR